MQAFNTTGHIYLVDDDASIRAALTSTLERQGYSVNAYEDTPTFLKHSTPVSPAVVLLDMLMPGQNGLEAQASLTQSGWTTPVIFISGESLPDQIVQAMKQGASDFLLKPFSMQELLLTIERCLEKDRILHGALTKTLALQKLYSRLTPRERAVFEQVIQGKSNKQIAQEHGSAAATVKLHRARVLAKMQVDSLAALLTMLTSVDLVQMKQPLTLNTEQGTHF